MSSPRPELRIDWCSHEAAKYAVMHWHYSRRMPMPPLLKLGVWEDSCFIGSVLFARGNTPNLGNPYGLGMLEVCELVRIALTKHNAPVSQIATRAIALLKKSNPGLRLIVSFADPVEGHTGAIYQAMNWVYSGKSSPDKAYFYDGRWQHSREIRGGAFGSSRKLTDYSTLPTREVPGKHRYLYPLDRAMRRQIAPLAQPYPKRDTRPVNGDTLATSEAGRFDSEPGALIEAEPHGD